MGSVSTAIRAFFASLFNKRTATRVRAALNGDSAPAPDLIAQSPKVVEPIRPVARKNLQSDAISVLAALQREARLVDFLKEDLSGYSDEQVGAAVREIHRNSGSVLDRLFAIRSIIDDEEGAIVDVPAQFDAALFRLTGKVTGNAPFRGTLRHHGWVATRCELPEFTGGETAAKTIAPAEVEIT